LREAFRDITVGASEEGATAAPHRGQKRLSSGTSLAQDEQVITMRGTSRWYRLNSENQLATQEDITGGRPNAPPAGRLTNTISSLTCLRVIFGPTLARNY